MSPHWSIPVFCAFFLFCVTYTLLLKCLRPAIILSGGGGKHRWCLRVERVVIVHSPAFGGRGMFVTTGYKIEEEKLSPVFRGRGTFETDGPDEPSRNPPKPPKPPNPPKPPPLLPKSQFPSRNCMVIVLMAALVFVGTYVGGVGGPVFDMTCGYPGEGPVEVTDDLVMFFQHKFPEASLVPISEEIIRLGNHPLRYKIACRPTLYNYFGGWLGQGQRIYWRLQRLVNKLRKENLFL